jgi:hypothetical protein
MWMIYSRFMAFVVDFLARIATVNVGFQTNEEAFNFPHAHN